MATPQPQFIHVGRGDVWIGVQLPPSGQPVVLLPGGVPSDGAGNVSGRAVGSTLAESMWRYKPKTFDIRTQQNTGVAGYVIIEEDLEIEFTFGELAFENLRDLMGQGANQGDMISVGGIIVPSTPSVLLVAPRRAGGFIQAMLYAAYFSGDKVWTAAREKDSPFKVLARGQALASRPLGDQLGFIHPFTT
jgi:hypothetical protein